MSKTTLKKTKTRVHLYDLQQPMLLIPAETGIVYYNQVGGCGCFSMEAEGYLVPLPNIDLVEYEHFNPKVWYHLGDGIVANPPLHDMDHDGNALSWWDEFKETIEQDLPENEDWPKMKMIPPSKDKTQHYEAWVHVEVIIVGKKKRAILTWRNCD